MTDSRNGTGRGRTDVENEIEERIKQAMGEPKILTMNKKLIVEASTPGHNPSLLWERSGIVNMPPWTIEDQAATIVECAKAGAAAIHTHPRDPSAKYNYDVSIAKAMAPELAAQVFDKVYQDVDIIPLGHAWHPKDWEDLADADFITPTRELLDIGKGNKYMQGNIIPTWINPRSRKGLLSSWFNAKSLREGIAYLEENNVKPLIGLHMHHFSWFKDNIMDAGVMKTRPHFNIADGKHGVNTTFADPMSYLNLISDLELVKKVVPDCTIGLHAGGRNWLPMTVLGIMLGVDLVRVGIEDMFWSYPHKDEVIQKPSDSVEKIVQIARALGREIATPAEARKILGITVT